MTQPPQAGRRTGPGKAAPAPGGGLQRAEGKHSHRTAKTLQSTTPAPPRAFLLPQPQTVPDPTPAPPHTQPFRTPEEPVRAGQTLSTAGSAFKWSRKEGKIGICAHMEEEPQKEGSYGLASGGPARSVDPAQVWWGPKDPLLAGQSLSHFRFQSAFELASGDFQTNQSYVMYLAFRTHIGTEVVSPDVAQNTINGNYSCKW